MKRVVDVETLTECAEDLSLYNLNKRSKRLTTALSKIIPSILRKTTVDYVFLAISEILKKEQSFLKQKPTRADIDRILNLIKYILNSLDISDVTVMDDNVYVHGEILDDSNISYTVLMDAQIEQVMTPLQFPICVNIRLDLKHGSSLIFSIIREVHNDSILLRSDKYTTMTKSSAFSYSRVNKNTLNTLINNSQHATSRRLLCC